MGLERVRGWCVGSVVAFVLVASACKSNEINAVEAQCPEGFVDCNQDVADGCEVDTRADPNNCGACGTKCVANGGTAECTQSKCSTKCFAGRADCNGNPSDGCETDIAGDKANCGACGQACAQTNGAQTCAGGRCTIANCSSGFADCDGDTKNGCEVSISDSTANCGLCGNVCKSTANAAVSCQAAKCSIGCNGGLSNCSDVCVDLKKDPTNCGACGKSCGDNACHDSVCDATVASSLNFPAHVTAGSSFVFFSDAGNKTIYALPIDATDAVPTPFLEDLSAIDDDLVALDNRLYYHSGTDLFVIQDDKNGAAKIATGVAPHQWAVNNGRVYYANTTPSNFTIMSTALDGSGRIPVAPATNGSPSLVAPGGCALFVQAASPTSTIYNMPLVGGIQLNVASPDASKASYAGLGADPQHVYFNASTGWSRALRGGGGPQAMTPQAFLKKLRTDGTKNFALVSTSTAGAFDLLSWDVGGTTTTVMYPAAADFDLVGGSLFVADAQKGRIVRLAKPGTPGGGTAATETCSCKPGYAGDGELCRSCSFNNGGCDVNATCAAGSSLTCTCKSGWVGDGITCASACTVDNGGCDTNATCSNGGAGGTVACACNTSLGYSGNGTTCSYNSCTDSRNGFNGGCGGTTSAMCTDNSGTPSCTCKSPWAGGPDGADANTDPDCFLYKNGDYTVNTSVNVGWCGQATGGHPSFLFNTSTWQIRQSSPPNHSGTNDTTVFWSNSFNCPMTATGTPTSGGFINLTSSWTGTCGPYDIGGHTITFISLSYGSIGPTSMGLNGKMIWKGPNEPQAYTCDLQISVPL